MARGLEARNKEEESQCAAGPPAVAVDPEGRDAAGIQPADRYPQPARRDDRRHAARAPDAVQADRADAVGARRSAARVGEDEGRLRAQGPLSPSENPVPLAGSDCPRDKSFEALSRQII